MDRQRTAPRRGPSPSSANRWLVIMAKEPRAGAVKTRLARDIGVVAATRFHRQTLGAQVRRLGSSRRWRTALAVSPDASLMCPCWHGGVSLMGQGAGDLGRRMQRIADEMPPGPVVIVGSDIPAIKPSDIGEAFAKLGNHDVVFGPAGDGGYWLVGFKRMPSVPRIFGGVRWSSVHALADTIANAKGLDVALIRTLEDVDDGDSYRKSPGLGRLIRAPKSGT